MTVSSEVFKVTYAGDGSTTTFSTSFTFSSNDEISVTLVTNSTGAETAWVLGTQFTLTGAGTGSAGTVTVVTSPTDYTPASGTTLVIQLAPALTQTTALPRGGTVSPKDTLEPMHDKRVRQLLRLKEILDRAIRLPVGETTGGTIPIAALRAGKLMSFDAAGEPEVTTGRVTSGSGSGTSIPMGSTPTVTVTYNDSSGNLDLALGLPLGPQGDQGIQGNQGIQGIQGNQGDQGIQGIQGNPGNDGADGIFTQVATLGEAQTGTNNTVGMSPLRVKDAITFNAASVSNAAFYGFKTNGATLQVDVTTASGSETFTLSDYADSEFASLGLTFSINASGNLIFTTP